MRTVPSIRTHHSRDQSSAYSSRSRAARGSAAALASRLRGPPDFGFPSIGVHTDPCAGAKTTGVTQGPPPSADTIASRPTGQDARSSVIAAVSSAGGMNALQSAAGPFPDSNRSAFESLRRWMLPSSGRDRPPDMRPAAFTIPVRAGAQRRRGDEAHGPSDPELAAGTMSKRPREQVRSPQAAPSSSHKVGQGSGVIRPCDGIQACRAAGGSAILIRYIWSLCGKRGREVPAWKS